MNTTATWAIDSGTTFGATTYRPNLPAWLRALLSQGSLPVEWPIEYGRSQLGEGVIGASFRPTGNQTSLTVQAPSIDDQLAVALRDAFQALSSAQTELDADIARALNARRWNLYV